MKINELVFINGTDDLIKLQSMRIKVDRYKIHMICNYLRRLFKKDINLQPEK